MTGVKHTPGPWVPSYFGFQVLTGDSWNTICTLHSSNGDHRLAGWQDGRKATSVEANAWLIAAAPDLFDSLSEILAYDGGAANALDDPYVMERAHAALAKAHPSSSPPARAGHGSEG